MKISQFIIEKVDGLLFLVFAGSLESSLDTSNIRDVLNQITAKFGLSALQLFDNRYIWGYQHIFSAVWHARNAEKNNQMISKTLSMEILLYTAGLRQIQKAIQLLGIKNNTTEMVGVLLAINKSQLKEAVEFLEKKLQLRLDFDLLNNFSLKYQYFVEMLLNNGYSAKKFTYEEIEKAILQKIALLALEI